MRNDSVPVINTGGSSGGSQGSGKGWLWIIIALAVVAGGIVFWRTSLPRTAEQAAQVGPGAAQEPTPVTTPAQAGGGSPTSPGEAAAPAASGGKTPAAGAAANGIGDKPSASGEKSDGAAAVPSVARKPVPNVPTAVRSGERFVGVRDALEADGWKVHWVGEGGRVNCSKTGANLLQISIGQSSATLNAQPTTISPAPQLISDRTMVPPGILKKATDGRLAVDDNGKCSLIK